MTFGNLAMKSDVQGALSPLSPDSGFELKPADLSASSQTIPLVRNAMRASVMYLVVATLACAGEI
jgi:hypothetical protein